MYAGVAMKVRRKKSSLSIVPNAENDVFIAAIALKWAASVHAPN